MSTPETNKGKTPAAGLERPSPAGSGSGLGVSPLLRELGAEVEEAYDLIREIEYAFQRGWDWADDATRVVEHVRKAKRLVSELLPKVGKRRKRLLSNVVAYLGEVERRMQRILDGRGKLRDVGLALDFIRAAWVDVQFALGRIRRGAPVPDGVEDLLVPDVPEREVPEPLVEREAEYEAEFGEGW